ncbi:MAG: hypothetical protein JSV12_05215 [Candidatus Bathyarchaeota archaeon]|nr:MAG: hypothetical protein JSV12_05215 [Candidatus Bathyarchaeota archaeon]
MSNPLKQRIEELNSKLASLKEELDKLNPEARKWAEKRNSIHKQIKALRTKVDDLKEKRDELNKKVQELKNMREQARTERREKRTQILKLKEKLRRPTEKKPIRNMRDVESEIERLEWEIQTTSLPVREEKILIDQVRALENQLLTHKQIRKLEESFLELQAEEKALETKANLHHEKLSELAKQSQSFHEKVSEIFNKIHAFQVDADDAHQKYVEIKQKAQALHQERAEFLRQANSLMQELRQTEEKKQLKRQRELRKELVDKALGKMKRGEKLTWEEFKVVTEQKKVKSPKKTRKG